MRSEGARRFAGAGIGSAPSYADGGDAVLSLAGADPLGLADHPRVRRAAADAAERYGTGPSGADASRTSPARRLEDALAALLGAERAALYGSGHEAARASVLAAAGRRGALIAIDERASAGLLDGARASGAELLSYRHLDIGQVAAALRGARRREIVIATDSVFRQTGAAAPLAALAALAARASARMVVEESQAFGTTAPGAPGASASLAPVGALVTTGSLGRALAGQGGFACGSAELVGALRPALERPAPPACAAALAAIGLLVSSPGLVAALARNAAALREALADQGFEVAREGGHIVSIPAGDPRRGRALAARALERRIAVEVLAPPAVSVARVRLCARATHRADDLRTAARLLGQAGREVGVIGPSAGRLGQLAMPRAA